MSQTETLRRCTAHLCPFSIPGSLRGLDLGGSCCPGLWPLLCVPSTSGTSYTCQRCLFAVSLLLHSTPEKVSPSKWSFPPTPPWYQGTDQKLETCKQRTTQPKKRRGEWPQKQQVQQIKTPQSNWDCAFEGQLYTLGTTTAGTREYLTLNWLHAAHNSSRDIPRYTGGLSE